MAIKYQELLIKVGDSCIFRNHAPMKPESGIAIDKDYPGTVVHHGGVETRVAFTNDHGVAVEQGVGYSCFESGMSSLELTVPEEELERRREAVIADQLAKEEANYFETTEGIKAMFMDF